MELKVIHLLLLLIGVVVLGYFGYKAREGFATTPAVNLSCVPTTSTDASGSSTPDTTDASGSAMDACGQMVSMNSLLGLAGAPPTDTGSMAPYLPKIESVIRSEFLNHALNIPDSPVSSDGTLIAPISDIQGLAARKANDANALQTIQKVVHNELLSQKGMTTGAQLAFLGQKKDRKEEEEEEEEEEEDSPSNYQGREYTRDCAKNTGTRNSARVPDMSKYIRKDSIPCWGCTLPQ
jgi:hypothetical protein